MDIHPSEDRPEAYPIRHRASAGHTVNPSQCSVDNGITLLYNQCAQEGRLNQQNALLASFGHASIFKDMQ